MNTDKKDAVDAQACAHCCHYRMALHAIAEAAREDVPVSALADLAELALMAPPAAVPVPASPEPPESRSTSEAE